MATGSRWLIGRSASAQSGRRHEETESTLAGAIYAIPSTALHCRWSQRTARLSGAVEESHDELEGEDGGRGVLCPYYARAEGTRHEVCSCVCCVRKTVLGILAHSTLRLLLLLFSLIRL